MNLHVSESALASNARSSAFRNRIAAIHAYRTMIGVDQEPFWPGMWMWELITLPPKYPPPTPLAVIVKAVSKRCGLTRSEVMSAGQVSHVVRARHLIFYLVRELTGLSYPKIGARVGGRDHTTVLYGCRKIEALLQSGDKQTTDDIEYFLNVLAHVRRAEA